MSMTREEVKLHEQYEAMDAATKEAIDTAYTVARAALADICKPANDDRAEAFVAAIVRYYNESNESKV